MSDVRLLLGPTESRLPGRLKSFFEHFFNFQTELERADLVDELLVFVVIEQSLSGSCCLSSNYWHMRSFFEILITK